MLQTIAEALITICLLFTPILLVSAILTPLLFYCWYQLSREYSKSQKR